MWASLFLLRYSHLRGIFLHGTMFSNRDQWDEISLLSCGKCCLDVPVCGDIRACLCLCLSLCACVCARMCACMLPCVFGNCSFCARSVQYEMLLKAIPTGRTPSSQYYPLMSLNSVTQTFKYFSLLLLWRRSLVTTLCP